MSGDLLSSLQSPAGPGNGLPAAGRFDPTGTGMGAGGLSGGTNAYAAGEGPALPPSLLQPGAGTAKTPENPGSAVEASGGVDFLSFGELAPEDFEPPERLDDDFDYFVSRYNAPTGGDGYFRVQITGRRSLIKLATMPKDVVFMIDTSRSIPQNKVDEVVKGVLESLRVLNKEDRFNLILFSEQTYFFSQEPVPATRANVDVLERWLRGVRSRGFTDVNLAIRQLLKRDIEPGRVYELFLISDGKPTLGVLDTRELINLITRENDLNASIYCIGIGRDQDNRLLDFLAYRNKGFSVSTTKRTEIAGLIRDLMSRLRYPIITDVRVRFAGQGLNEVYPLYLPNVHQGESFDIYGRFDQPGPFTMQITGNSAGKRVDFTFRSDLQNAIPGRDDVAKGWAFWKLHHLYSEIIRLGEKPELLRAISDLRRRYELNTLY
jgi:Mg-chelatase subunit ChlD